MAFGARVRNDAAEIQIDAQWQTLRVRERGSLAILTNNDASGYAALASPPTPADAPFFAVHSTAIHAAAHTPMVDVTDLDDIDMAGPIVELRCRKIGSGAVTHTVDWICVDATTPAPTTDTFGLRVRDADGDPVFDSRQDLVLIRDVILIGTSATLTRTFSHAACRGTPYYASGVRRAYTGVVGLEPVLYCKALSASSVEVFFQGGNQLAWAPDPVPLLVLDVFG